MAAGDRNFLRILKGGLCLLFLCIFAQPNQLQAQTNPDFYQSRFELGVEALFSGNPEQAERIFEALYQDTKAIRVKLEWARAAFMSRKYELSKKLFNEVLEENVPDAVRFNVSLFLTEITKFGNHTDYGFNFVKDSNPFAVTSTRKILIFGIPFNYTPPTPNQTLNGVRFFFANSSVILDAAEYRLLTELDATKYEGDLNDRSALKIAIQYTPGMQNLSYRLGIDHYHQKSELLLRQPYAAATYRVNQLSGLLNHWEVEARFGSNQYPDFPQVDGGFYAFNFSGRKNILTNLQATFGFYLDDADAKQKSQGYKTLSKNLGVKYFWGAIGSAMQVNYVNAKRNYGEIDDLFMVKRLDNRKYFSVMIQPYRFRFQGLYPSVEIASEKNDSNLSISTYNKRVVNFGLRKNF